MSSASLSTWSWNEVLANSMERAEREGLTDGVARAKGRRRRRHSLGDHIS